MVWRTEKSKVLAKFSLVLRIQIPSSHLSKAGFLTRSHWCLGFQHRSSRGHRHSAGSIGCCENINPEKSLERGRFQKFLRVHFLGQELCLIGIYGNLVIANATDCQYEVTLWPLSDINLVFFFVVVIDIVWLFLRLPSFSYKQQGNKFN